MTARVLIVTRDEANDRWIVTKRVPGAFGTRISWYYTWHGVFAAVQNWNGVIKFRAKRKR